VPGLTLVTDNAWFVKIVLVPTSQLSPVAAPATPTHPSYTDIVGAEAPEIQAYSNVPLPCAFVISAAVTGSARACVEAKRPATANAILVNFMILLLKNYLIGGGFSLCLMVY
jgi:hypothetical protein